MRNVITEYSQFLQTHFKGKVQKISINAGFTCPNRDGSKGFGGCTYCNNQTFSPQYCGTHKSITQQIEEGQVFFARKYPEMRYLAYFQAYTNTYDSTEKLIAMYQEALAVPNVVGLVIGTRPDCMPPDLLEYLTILSKTTFVMVEYGVESTCDTTLKRINRGHSYQESVDAIVRTAERGIMVGAHLILGLPGENEETIIAHAKELSKLPITSIKLHQLQLIRHTKMAQEYNEHPEDFNLYTPDQYIDLVIAFLKYLSPQIIVERYISQSPAQLLIAPHWGLKNHEFTAKLHAKLTKECIINHK